MTDRPVRRPIALQALLLCCGLLVPAAAGAQSTITLTVTPSSFTFPTPGVAEFNAGLVDYSGGVSAQVQPSNAGKEWSLSLRSSSADMGGYGKPIGDLQWRLEGSTTWNAMTTTDVELARAKGNATVVVHFRTLLQWAADAPATYGATLTFTAVYR